MRDAAFVRGVVNVGGDVKQVGHAAQHFAAVGDAGRNLDHAMPIVGSEQNLLRLLIGGRIGPQVVQGQLERADRHVPPIYLLLMQVPGLGRARVHQRVAELAEAFREKLIRAADDLAEDLAIIAIPV